MNTLSSTPYSKRSRSPTTEARSEVSDNSCYFPGCKKDANCNCEICLASINATLDLMPMSVHKSSLTKLSASTKFMAERTPTPIKRSILTTPIVGIRQISETPLLKSSAKSSNVVEKRKTEEKEKEKSVKRGGFGFDLRRLIVGLSVIFALDSGFSWVFSGVFEPLLSDQMVRKVGEECWVGNDFNHGLGSLQKQLKVVIDEEVFDCSSSADSKWEVNRDGFVVNSHCTLYKSTAEEVCVWGWPLQTAGLLTAGFSSRSLTILSGRVTEWPNGETGFVVHEANSSWVLERLGASAVQLDPNTWILEYKRNPVLEHSSLSSAALEFLKFRMMRVVDEMKQHAFLLTEIAHLSTPRVEEDFKHPT